MSDAAPPTEDLPLAGLTVLDVSSFIAAPAAAVALGDFGADVIKVEPPGAGDPHRASWLNPGYPRAPVNFTWQLDARNKRSVALDLKAPAGRAALDRLIAKADVLITNFPPRVRARLRLDWADVEPVNPRLIHCALTGYGESGPDRDRPGFDVTAFFARSGILDALRYEDAPPGFSLPAQGDRCTAMTLVAAVMIALYRRERTGKGGAVGTSLYANGVWSNGTLAQAALLGAIQPPRPPREKARSVMVQQYRAGDGRWFLLAANPEDKHWSNLCKALGRPEFETDPRFAVKDARRANTAALLAAFEAVFATRDWPHWERALGAVNVPCEVIGRVIDIVEDPQARHAGIVAPTTNPEIPATVNNPVRLGFAEPRLAGAPPSVGQHTDEILRFAGYDDDEIAALRRDGAAA